jgi:hypothetical protein
MYDGEPAALKTAYKLAATLSTVIPKVEVVELESDDPDSMDDQEILEFKQEINLF